MTDKQTAETQIVKDKRFSLTFNALLISVFCALMSGVSYITVHRTDLVVISAALSVFFLVSFLVFFLCE